MAFFSASASSRSISTASADMGVLAGKTGASSSSLLASLLLLAQLLLLLAEAERNGRIPPECGASPRLFLLECFFLRASQSLPARSRLARSAARRRSTAAVANADLTSVSRTRTNALHRGVSLTAMQRSPNDRQRSWPA